MLKKTMTYTDYNGVEKTEDFYFNLDKAEVVRMLSDSYGSLPDMIQEIVDAKDTAKIVEVFEKLVLDAYGEKTVDGRFVKSEEIRNNFKSTAAYSDLFMELSTDDKAASDFVNGILPEDLDTSVDKISETKKSE